MSAVIRSWDSEGRLVYRVRQDVVDRLKNGEGEERRGSDTMDYVVLQLESSELAVIPARIAEYLRGGGGVKEGGYTVDRRPVGPADLIRNDNCGCELIIREFTG